MPSPHHCSGKKSHYYLGALPRMLVVIISQFRGFFFFLLLTRLDWTFFCTCFCCQWQNLQNPIWQSQRPHLTPSNQAKLLLIYLKGEIYTCDTGLVHRFVSASEVGVWQLWPILRSIEFLVPSTAPVWMLCGHCFCHLPKSAEVWQL